jgi:hypothetical protein
MIQSNPCGFKTGACLLIMEVSSVVQSPELGHEGTKLHHLVARQIEGIPHVDEQRLLNLIWHGISLLTWQEQLMSYHRRFPVRINDPVEV